MPPLHVPIFLVILLIPNSTWTTWRTNYPPAFQQILRSSAVAVMNDRTAEDDHISTESGERTLFAGARMYASTDTSRLDYPVLPNNLIVSMQAARIAIEPKDASTKGQIGPATAGKSGTCIVEELRSQPEPDFGEIARWQSEVAKQHGILVLISPNPGVDNYEKEYDQLTPIAIWGAGIQPSVLHSPATKLSGFITNTDFAPTVASLCGIKLLGPTYGSAAVLESGDFSTWDRRIDGMTEKAKYQTLAQMWVPAIAAILSLVMLTGLMNWKEPARGVAPKIVSVYSLFVVCLLICLQYNQLPILVPCLTAALILLIINQSRNWLASITLVCSLTVAAELFILLDILFNQCSLTASSLLGYNLLEGARYYGVGNEAMGILIGATTIITGLISVRKSGLLIGCAIWLFVAAVLGVPSLGAKAGGLIVALVSLAAFVAANAKLPANRAQKLAIVFGAPIAIGLLSLVAISHFEGSHVSQTMGQAKEHGSSVIWSVIVRKAAMDTHLVFHSAWILVLMVTLVGLTITYRTHGAQIQADPLRRSILLTGCASIAACLVLNDAGVVAAALCAVFPWSYLTIPAPARSSPTLPQPVGMTVALFLQVWKGLPT